MYAFYSLFAAISSYGATNDSSFTTISKFQVRVNANKCDPISSELVVCTSIVVYVCVCKHSFM